MRVLLTGGAGYIGSHAAVELLHAGHQVVIVDNLVNSSAAAVSRVEQIADQQVRFYQGDVRAEATLEEIFTAQSINAVIHFAGLKAVGESTSQPLRYYRNNIDSTLTLLEVMARHGVNRLIFSSSATVYGNSPIPYHEDLPTGQGITNAYAQTKYMIEQIMRDTAASWQQPQFTILRYFNPIGAHPSGLIGEHPQGIPNNLMPFVTQVAAGVREELAIFGKDYDTVDGTAVRDYIHVVDLARGHLAALEKANDSLSVFNLGTGQGTSVLELIAAFENATGVTIPRRITARRPGDLPVTYADAAKAATGLGWRTELSVEDACRDSWNWQSKNPTGYPDTCGAAQPSDQG